MKSRIVLSAVAVVALIGACGKPETELDDEPELSTRALTSDAGPPDAGSANGIGTSPSTNSIGTSPSLDEPPIKLN